jgi:hypothetical protein
MRRRKTLIADLAEARAEIADLRYALAELGRQLVDAQHARDGETAPMPRMRSRTPGIDLTRPGDQTQLLMTPWPPKEWTT